MAKRLRFFFGVYLSVHLCSNVQIEQITTIPASKHWYLQRFQAWARSHRYSYAHQIPEQNSEVIAAPRLRKLQPAKKEALR